ncbi:Zinc finger protein with KRAB and SCAN domains 8 [Frankliniella fusca]|uniref:Zinc finger protein with KRAB and SCAN domains 8 n=1 Tax=Frankliniella fusca TaxID=407009 RepID=A0AAE1LQL4_9NEOP|nr:Zinc finger protein with KRAB and SCAN domains 8 [Frankliniella fusca]
MDLQINPSEDLPSKICNMCLKEVNQWDAFRAKCQSTNNVLSEVLRNKHTLVSVNSNPKVIENHHPKKLVLLSRTVECEAVDVLSERQTSKRPVEDESINTFTNQQKKIELKSKTATDTSKSSFTKDNELNSIIVMDFSGDTLNQELNEKQEVDNQSSVGQTKSKQQDNDVQECHSDTDSDSENVTNNADDDDTSSLSEESSKNEDSEEFSSHEVDLDVPLVAQDDESKSWRWKKVKCPKCPKIFPKHYSLKCHLQNIHSLFKCYPCAVCGHTSVSSTKRENHVIKSHEDLLEKNPKRMCKVCGVITKTKTSYWRHLKKHKEDKCCKVCNTTFNSQEELEAHSKTVHEAEETLSSSQADGAHIFKCHHCKDVLLRNEKDWKEHYIVVHFTRAVYTCDQCEKTYRTKEHLEMHKRSHAGEKPYMCDVCAVRFTGKSSLRSHMKTHASRKYECKICQKVYSSYTGLYSHNRATHREIDPFVCHECGKKFKSANGVQFHMRTHTGSIPPFHYFPYYICN